MCRSIGEQDRSGSLLTQREGDREKKNERDLLVAGTSKKLTPQHFRTYISQSREKKVYYGYYGETIY